MKLHSTLLAACASLALGATGCLVGDIDTTDPITTPPETSGPIVDGSETPPPSATGNPEDLFNAEVSQALEQTCASAPACHTATAPVFVSDDPANNYTLIKNFKDQMFPNYSTVNARLLVNGEGGHYGATFDTTQVQAITKWLAAEAAQPIDDQPSPLAVWSGCMDLAELEASGFADAVANRGTNSGQCKVCHNLAQENFIAANSDKLVFELLTKDPGLMLSYFTINEAGTEVIINTPRLEKVGTRQAPHQGHPAFNLNGDPMQRLQNFYDQTKARLDAGTCLPPRFGQPITL